MREIQKRRKILSEKKLCFNCTGTQHCASACKSKRTSQMCQKKHHASICDKSGNVMFATENLVIHTVVVLKVKNVTCHALLDTGAGSFSIITEQTQGEFDSEGDQEYQYDTDFNNQKTRSLQFRNIEFARKINIKFESLQSGEKYTSIITKSKR